MVGKSVAALVLAALVVAAAGKLGSRAAGADLNGEWRVPAQASLQDALNRAKPGDTIVLEAGRTYTGPFVLRRHADGDAWITIRGDRAADPAGRRRAGRRVGPADAGQMPKLIAASGAVLAAEAGAHHYRLEGLEVAPAPNAFLDTLIDLGSDASDAADTPRDFVLERLYVHGDAARGSRRGLALNSASTTVSDSYFSDFKERGNDSQAICGWNGPGPFTITNNYLEAAGENLMFGGGDPRIANLVPSDIAITDNLLSKPLGWRAPVDAQTWTIKNILELKNARRVVIERNILEHTWTAAQVGFAVLFTPRNQDGAAPWSVVEDVTFRNNVVRQVSGGIHLLGRDDIHQSRQLQRVRIANNLFEEVTAEWGTGRLFQIIDGTADVTIDHNTATNVETAVFAGETVPNSGFVFTNNLIVRRQFGVIGSGTSAGTETLARYFPNAVVRGNALVGDSAVYPPGNFFPASAAAVGFVDPARGNFGLAASSPLHAKSTDGHDVGVDITELSLADGAAVARGGVVPMLLVAAKVVFWSAVCLIAYVYIGYPVLLWAAARTGAWPVRRGRAAPDVTVVVVAHNEGERIRRRIENLKESTYRGRQSIVVVSDGSTDDTVAAARSVASDVRVIELPARRGKPAALNQIVPALDTDIVILADARQRFAPDAIQALVADFADPRVGVVSGQLVIGAGPTTNGAAQGAGLYWRYETCIRRWESVVNSSVGVTGAITALRRSLFEPLPADTVLDDLLIPLRVMRRGYRVIFEPRARAFDGAPASARDEFARKVRTLAGNFQLFARDPWLLWPSQNRIWLQTISHKALRLLLPVLFTTALATNVVLAGTGGLYGVSLAAQGAFYALAAAGWRSPRLRQRVRPIIVPYMICFLTCATVMAFLRVVRGGQSATWDRAAIGEPA